MKKRVLVRRSKLFKRVHGVDWKNRKQLDLKEPLNLGDLPIRSFK
jgi:hypothetical protein